MTGDLSDLDLRQNVKQRATWIRLIYMLVLAVIWQVAEIVLWLIVILQFLIKLVTGKALDSLTDFGDALGAYMAQIVRFETFVTEDIPFPFAPWPSGATGKGAAPKSTPPASATPPAEAKPATARRSTAKGEGRKTTRKAAPKKEAEDDKDTKAET